MTKIIVYHRGHGCETGCCGHAIEVDGEEVRGSFKFSHPWGDSEEEQFEWAKSFVAKEMGDEHVKDLDWTNCMVVDD